MARTTLPLSAFTGESTTLLTDPAGTAVDPTNGMVILASALQTETIPPTYDALRGLVLRVDNTLGSNKTVTVKAGVNPPAFRKDIGDLVCTVTASTTMWIGPFDLARHQQSDGSINIDLQSGITGTITAFIAPRQP